MVTRREFFKFTGVMGAAALAGFALSGCGNGNASSSATSSAAASSASAASSSAASSAAATSSSSAASSAAAPAAASASASPSAAASRILVACFSATGNTRPIAKAAAQALNADYFEIEPAEPYTEDDLNYSDSSTRATDEQNNPETRPALASTPDYSAYDVLLIGHPIWWGKAPRLICTFLESGDLSGKTIAEFCTSGSSGIDEANAELKELIPNANWIDAHRFAVGASDDEVAAWATSLNIG